MIRKTIILICGGLAALTLTSVVCTGKELPEGERLTVIARLASRLISKNHYRQQEMDNDISEKLFNGYFKMLDPNNLYFTDDDVKKFEHYRHRLDDLIILGKTDFAFEVYDLYLERLDEYRQFAEEELKKGFDFTREESFTVDRRELPRSANHKELTQVWRRKLKNDLLYFRLMKKAMEAEQLEATDADDATAKENMSEEQQKILHELWYKRSPEEKIMRRLRDIHNEVSQKEKIDIMGLYLTCLAQAYGPHSGYFSPKDEEDFNINMKLSLEGIGAVLTSDDGYTKVVKIMPGGPAAKDGRLKPEDRIIAVTEDGQEPVDIIDMSVSNVVKLIRGNEGSKVTLTVLPGSKGRNSVPVNLTLTRAKVELKESEASGKVIEVKDENDCPLKIGVITLPRFYMDFDAAFRGEPDFKSSSRDTKKFLDEYTRQKVDGVIMDLRSNGGGSLVEAINLTGLFIKQGPVVQVRQSNRKVAVKYDPDDNIHYRGPLLVLVNKLTSSAAEIFAGAVKDYNRGIIVGDSRTYGKGTVLDVIQLRRLLNYINQDFPAGTVKLESAMFYRVNGSSTQQLGVSSDIVIPSFTEHMELGELYNDNHLPWDAIDQVPRQIFNKKLAPIIETAKQRSQVRLSSNDEFQALKKNIQIFDKLKSRKKISLHEEQRWKDYLNEKKLMDEANKKLMVDRYVTGDEPQRDSDFLLNEALHIIADVIELNKKDDSKKTPAVILAKSKKTG